MKSDSDSSLNRTISELTREEIIQFAQKAMVSIKKLITVSQDGVNSVYEVTRLGLGPLDTEHGEFWHFNFQVSDDWHTYNVLVKAELDENLMPVFLHPECLNLRIDSGCETGQLFKDQTCECREQLFLAMDHVDTKGEGIIINIPNQDGRGMGLSFKLSTMILQKYGGFDTVDAAMTLANTLNPMDIDVRSYWGVVAILKFLGVDETFSIALATNNPEKTRVFAENGINLIELVPMKVEPTSKTKVHLDAKQRHLGHNL